MLVVHKHKKNINLSRDMNYRSLLFLVLLLWAWQIKKWPKPQIKGLVWKKILILYCLHKLGNLLYEKHGQKANSKFFECPRVLGSYHPWMTICWNKTKWTDHLCLSVFVNECFMDAPECIIWVPPKHNMSAPC